MSLLFEKKNEEEKLTFLDFIHEKLCSRVYLFLYRLTGLCEDRRLKMKVKKALEEAEQNKHRVQLLDENKEQILGGIELLRQRILELEEELLDCESRSKLVGNYENEISFLLQNIETIYRMTFVNSSEEIRNYILQINSKG